MKCHYALFDEYGLLHWPSLLVRRGRNNRLRTLLSDFGWLQKKIEATSASSLLSDYENLPGCDYLRVVQSAIRLSESVLNADTSQLGSQLVGRLLTYKTHSRGIRLFLQSISRQHNSPWLCPISPVLNPPDTGMVRTIRGHKSAIYSIAITPDGKRIVSASGDKTLKIWDIESGRELHTLRGHRDQVLSLALSKDGTFAMSVSADGSVRSWDLNTGKSLETLDKWRSRPRCVALTRTSGIIGCSDGSIHILDLNSYHRTHLFPGHAKRYGTGFQCTIVRRCGKISGHTGSVQVLTVTPDERFLISGGRDSTAIVWSLEHKKELRSFDGHRDSIQALAVTPDGKRVVSASWDSAIKLWNINTGKEVINYIGRARQPIALTVTPDGRTLICGGEERKVRLWDVESGRKLLSFVPHGAMIFALTTTPEGRYLVTASNNAVISIVDLHHIRNRRQMPKVIHADSVWGIVITPDGRWSVSASDDNTMRVWDIAMRKVVTVFSGQMEEMPSAQPQFAGKRKPKHNITVQEVDDIVGRRATSRIRQMLDNPPGLAITPDKRWAIAQWPDRILKLWRLDPLQELRTIKGVKSYVVSKAFASNGRFQVSIPEDTTVVISKWRSGRPLCSFTGESLYRCCDITPDGRIIMVGDIDGHVHFFRLTSTQLLHSYAP